MFSAASAERTQYRLDLALQGDVPERLRVIERVAAVAGLERQPRMSIGDERVPTPILASGIWSLRIWIPSRTLEIEKGPPG
jgi:hypothetical protein